MPATKESKAIILQKLVDKFSRGKTVVFSGYRGLGVKGMSDLRKRLRATESEMQIAKKTLLRLAAKQNKLAELPDAVLEGPVATTFCYTDEFSGLQALYKFSKENEALTLLGGIMDGQVVDAETIIKYAKLPGKQELLTKLLWTMNGPIGAFVRALAAIKDKLNS